MSMKKLTSVSSSSRIPGETYKQKNTSNGISEDVAASEK